MNQMKEKELEMRVIGVGNIIIRQSYLGTRVEGGKLIQRKYYLRPFEEVKNMVLKRLNNDYPNRSVLITPRMY